MQKKSLNILKQAKSLFYNKSAFQISNFNKRGFSGIARPVPKTFIQKMMEKAATKSDKVEIRLLSIHNKNMIRMNESVRALHQGYVPVRTIRNRLVDRSRHLYGRAAYRGLNFIRRLKGKPRIEDRMIQPAKPSFLRRNWLLLSGLGVVSYMFMETLVESIKFVSSLQKH